jgi:hypothetical protein
MAGATALLRSWISGAGLAGRAAWGAGRAGRAGSARVAGYERVRQIDFTDHFPRSLAGKIPRRLLAAEGKPTVTGFLPGG